MKKYAVTVASIAVLLLFSGCTTFPDLFSSSFSPVEPVSQEMTNDVIVVKNLKSVPERVYTSSEFSVIFILKHEGEPASSMESKAKGNRKNRRKYHARSSDCKCMQDCDR